MRWVGESLCGRLAQDPAPSGHVAVPDPCMVRVVRTGAGGPGPLWGSGPRRSARSFPSLETRGVTGPILMRGMVRGRWLGEGKAWPVGPGYSVLLVQLRITTQVLPSCRKSGYPCYRVPTVAPGPTLGEVRTHRWGHFCYLALFSLKLLSAGVLTGFDYPSGWLLPHHIATAS